MLDAAEIDDQERDQIAKSSSRLVNLNACTLSSSERQHPFT